MRRKYWYWINNIEGIGNTKLHRLLESYEEPENIYNASEEELKLLDYLEGTDVLRITSHIIREKAFSDYDKIMNSRVKMVFPFEAEYPERLIHLSDNPCILYYCGHLPSVNRKAVAIVGSRKCTEYGRYMAEELGRTLAENDVDVISGLALGIDSEAGRSTCNAGGRHYAVLAGGSDKCYPAQNYNLYMDTLTNGGIISEYGPGTVTVPGMFPVRNRIISGLADIVVVVEAGIQSGSLITANSALNQGKTIFAVPGRITDEYSRGCNELIAEGAELLQSIQSFLIQIGIDTNLRIKNEKINLSLACEEKMLYSQLLDFTPRSLEELIRAVDMPAGAVFTGLVGLELKGLIKEISKNYYVRLR